MAKGGRDREQESKGRRIKEQADSKIGLGPALGSGIGNLFGVPMGNVGAGLLFGITLGIAFRKALALLLQVQRPKWEYWLVGSLMLSALIGLVYVPVYFTRDW